MATFAATVPRRWTKVELDFLRDNYGKLSFADMASELSRSVTSVRSKAKAAGISKSNRIPEAHKQYVRENYHAMTAKQIADHLGTTTSRVNRIAGLEGMAKLEKMPPDFRDFIKEKNAVGLNDSEITEEWNATRDRKTDRRYVSSLRSEMGLPPLHHTERSLEKIRNNTRRQLAEAGLESIGQLRVEAFKKFAKSRGWPEMLPPRCVEILDAIYDYGPQTRRQLCELVKMPWKGSRKSLVGSVPGGSYLAFLQRVGLVVRLNRAVQVIGEGTGKSVSLYGIPPSIKRGAPATWPQGMESVINQQLSNCRRRQASYRKS